MAKGLANRGVIEIGRFEIFHHMAIFSRDREGGQEERISEENAEGPETIAKREIPCYDMMIGRDAHCPHK